MKTKIVSMLIGTCVCAITAFAQDDVRVLRLARFESEAAYQQYADWIADVENIRFAIIANGKRWTPAMEAWAKAYVQQPAKVESNDGIYLITYAEGGLEEKSAGSTLEIIAMAYAERLARRDGREEAVRREDLAQEFDELNREAEAIGRNSESLETELREIQERLLKAKLQAAQAEARAKALMEFDGKKGDVASENDSGSAVNDLRRQLAERKLEDAHRRLKHVTDLSAAGRISESEVSDAEIAVGEAELEVAEMKEELAIESQRPDKLNLRPMLIEAEAERASALALDAVLREQEEKLRAMLEAQRVIQDRKRSLEQEKKHFEMLRQESTLRRPSRGYSADGPRLITPES